MGSFYFIFIANGSKYIYCFSADRHKVYEEYLYQYLTAKPTRIFERTNVNEYKFLQSDESKLNTLKTQNMEDMGLFLLWLQVVIYGKIRKKKQK